MRLLLDIHIPGAVALQLRRSGFEALILADLVGTKAEGMPDEVLLAIARSHGRVLVTYDCQTIPPVTRAWAAEGESHTGVVLVDDRTIRSDDVGGLVRALRRLIREQGDDNWIDRVQYLPRAQE